MKNYFNILGITENASEEDIKKAYRKLAMKHHPDRGGDQNQFQEIQEAYSVLTDPQKRSQWELQRRSRGGNPFGGAQGAQPGGFHFNFNFGQSGGDPFDLHDLFRNFHQGNDPFSTFRQQQQLRRNKDLRVVIDLDLASTLEKQTKHISVKHLNGQRETVTIEIPRGINNNVQMKYAGHGDKSHSDLPPGDLYINFRVHAHPDFSIEGIDLVKIIKLNCIDAITGTTVNLFGLNGSEFSFNIPVGTQNGSRFKIGHQGLWSVEHSIRGNLILQIETLVPTNLNTEQLLLLEKISKELKENNGASL
jgi:DnaJ-class molecular chaperone